MAQMHRRRPAVVSIALNINIETGRRGNPRHDTNGQVFMFQHFALLDVHLKHRLQRLLIKGLRYRIGTKPALFQNRIEILSALLVQRMQILHTEFPSHGAAAKRRRRKAAGLLTHKENNLERVLRTEAILAHAAHSLDRRQYTRQSVIVAALRNTVTV